MRKILLLLVGLIVIGGTLQAQDGKKDFKKANRLLGTYNLDPGTNADKLAEAKTLIDNALMDEEVMGMAKAWAVKGKIYNEMIGSELNQKILDPEFEVKNLAAAGIAHDALLKGFELAQKSHEKRDIFAALKATSGHLANAAITTFQEKDYGKAFDNFARSISLNDFFIENEKEPSFLEETALKDQYFYTAISGYYAGMYEEVMPFFTKSLEMGDPDPFIYEGLYNMLKDTDPEKSIAYLQEGREKYPDDTALLYAEINYMIAEEKLEELIIKLEDAAEKDPENVSVFTTLGSVYDNLSTKSIEAGDEAKAGEYFDGALKWFNKALEIDANSFDALYSIGALYYNKAASFTEPLNELANDFSAEGNKKYDALKAKMDDLFETAFPFFQKAEMAKPDDLNTLIAIKEIYARKGDIEKSNEYKEKIEAVNN